MPDSTTGVTISSSGLASSLLFHGLAHYAHLDVRVLESTETSTEAGAEIGLARNALAALDLIGLSATQCLKGPAPFLSEAESQGKRVTGLYRAQDY
ncbi:hypothetical protein GGR58DRAFT_499871 [Xylaria digitata]|nr:hypothetical protein GGR58DRAFT_499871 [Xylaria digitata]